MVYAKFRKADRSPLLEHPLKAIMTEQDQGFPGVERVVPQLGVYALEVQGAGKANAQFQPFTLTYNVTVARGAAFSLQTARQDHAQTHSVPSRTKAQPLAPKTLGLSGYGIEEENNTYGAHDKANPTQGRHLQPWD